MVYNLEQSNYGISFTFVYLEGNSLSCVGVEVDLCSVSRLVWSVNTNTDLVGEQFSNRTRLSDL